MRLAPILLLLATAAAGAAPAPDTTAPPEATVAAAPGPAVTAPTAGTTPATAPDTGMPPAPAWAPQLRRDAQAVLAGKDFHGEATSSGIVARDWLRRLLDRPEEKPTARTPDLGWLLVVAGLLKVLMVALLLVAIAWLLWRGWQWLAPRARSRRPGRAAGPVQEARSLALPDTPLPPDVGRAARAAWQAGKPDLALSLLYRGALRALAEHYRIELPASATEGECLRRARASGKAVVGSGFAPLVQAWMALAYAGRRPADFEALLALYARHFEGHEGETP